MLYLNENKWKFLLNSSWEFVEIHMVTLEEKRRLVKNNKENKQKSSTNRNGSEVRPVNNKTKPTVR